MQALPRPLVALTSLGFVLALTACGNVAGPWALLPEWGVARVPQRVGVPRHVGRLLSIRRSTDGRSRSPLPPVPVEGRSSVRRPCASAKGPGDGRRVHGSVGGACHPSPTTKAERRTDLTRIIGRWRIPGETDVFEFRPNGTYTWGPRFSGSYRILTGAAAASDARRGGADPGAAGLFLSGRARPFDADASGRVRDEL